jgi:hypothetical protein
LTTDDHLRTIARRLLATLVRDHSAEASMIASLMLTEILAVGLHGEGGPADVDEFVTAINFKLAEVALRHGADRAWCLVPCPPPTRQ